MPSVNLSDADWGQVMAIIGEAPWKIAHPLMMKIGEQLRQQAQQPVPPTPPPGIRLDSNGKEVSHE